MSHYIPPPEDVLTRISEATVFNLTRHVYLHSEILLVSDHLLKKSLLQTSKVQQLLHEARIERASKHICLNKSLLTAQSQAL